MRSFKHWQITIVTKAWRLIDRVTGIDPWHAFVRGAAAGAVTAAVVVAWLM